MKMIYSYLVKETGKRGRLQKLWTDTVSKSLKARRISDDVRGMIVDHVLWKYFICKVGSVNGDLGFS